MEPERNTRVPTAHPPSPADDAVDSRWQAFERLIDDVLARVTTVADGIVLVRKRDLLGDAATRARARQLIEDLCDLRDSSALTVLELLRAGRMAPLPDSEHLSFARCFLRAAEVGLSDRVDVQLLHDGYEAGVVAIDLLPRKATAELWGLEDFAELHHLLGKLQYTAAIRQLIQDAGVAEDDTLTRAERAGLAPEDFLVGEGRFILEKPHDHLALALRHFSEAVATGEGELRQRALRFQALATSRLARAGLKSKTDAELLLRSALIAYDREPVDVFSALSLSDELHNLTGEVLLSADVGGHLRERIDLVPLALAEGAVYRYMQLKIVADDGNADVRCLALDALRRASDEQYSSPVFDQVLVLAPHVLDARSCDEAASPNCLDDLGVPAPGDAAIRLLHHAAHAPESEAALAILRDGSLSERLDEAASPWLTRVALHLVAALDMDAATDAASRSDPLAVEAAERALRHAALGENERQVNDALYLLGTLALALDIDGIIEIVLRLRPTLLRVLALPFPSTQQRLKQVVNVLQGRGYGNPGVDAGSEAEAKAHLTVMLTQIVGVVLDVRAAQPYPLQPGERLRTAAQAAANLDLPGLDSWHQALPEALLDDPVLNELQLVAYVGDSEYMSGHLPAVALTNARIAVEQELQRELVNDAVSRSDPADVTNDAITQRYSALSDRVATLVEDGTIWVDVWLGLNRALEVAARVTLRWLEPDGLALHTEDVTTGVTNEAWQYRDGEVGGFALRGNPYGLQIAELRAAVQTRPPFGPVSRDGARLLAEWGDRLFGGGVGEVLRQQHDLGRTHLAVSCNGPLWFAPLQLLTVGGLPLADTWTVSFVPTLAPFGRPPAQAGRRVLVAGSAEGGVPFGLPVVPEVEAEARDVARAWGTTPLLGGDAAPSALSRRAAGASWIHLACHGTDYPAAPAFQTLYLGPNDATGRVTSLDVLGWDLRATQLVTLAACEGALGRVDLAENLRGFIGAFVQAGARAVIGALWPIRPPVSHAFYAGLHESLAAGTSPLTAFAAALARTRQTFPAFADWGAFHFYGDWRVGR